MQTDSGGISEMQKNFAEDDFAKVNLKEIRQKILKVVTKILIANYLLFIDAA